MQKVISLSVMLSILAGIIGVQSAFASTIPPYDPPIESEITVKWGNVVGTPQNSNKVSFDGSIHMSEGDVVLVDTLKFDNHGDGKDEITAKENPVAWDSWIYGHYDGVKVNVKADPSATLYIDTDHGGLSVKYATLLTNESRTILKFGDGREIVVNVKKVVTDPFYVYALWGGPIATASSEVDAMSADAAIEARIADLNAMAEVASIETVLDAALTFAPPVPNPLVDFHGKLGVGAGARMDFVEPVLFESFHGDEILSEGENTVEWQSYINGHFDGVFSKVQLDQDHPIDDMIGVKFGGDVDWSKRYSLPLLYVQGILWDRVVVEGDTYLFALVATDSPICSLHGRGSTVCPQLVPVPVPLPAPEPIDIRPIDVEVKKPIERDDVSLFKVPSVLKSLVQQR